MDIIYVPSHEANNYKPSGLLVSIVILRQGLSLLAGAWGELTDAGVSPKTQQSLTQILNPLIVSSFPSSSSQPHLDRTLLGIRQLRARRAGSLMFVDLTADVSGRVSFNPVDIGHCGETCR
jgi:divalent metal cation (Fe/Co/Zn/Cd) transporter